jgi:hypothetical protein
MKKLFEIENSERQRILEMHQNATKKLYLNEQEEINEPTGYEKYTSVIVKGAEQHTENALSEVKKIGDKKFGANNYQILQTNTGYIVANNNVYQSMRELYDEMWSSSKIENSDPELMLIGDRVGYKKKKPDGGMLQEYVSGPIPLYQLMKKHLINGKGALNTLGARISHNQKIVQEFYNDPKNRFGELCNILKPTSVFKSNGFPGVGITCKLGDDLVWQQFNPNDYIRVDGKS